MSNNHSLYVATIVFFATAFLTGISACTGGSKSENNNDHQPRHADPGWVQLFNGETLDGWEITNFVLHGPVQVAEGSILLEMGDGCTGGRFFLFIDCRGMGRYCGRPQQHRWLRRFGKRNKQPEKI